jgi:hypothetical protein
VIIVPFGEYKNFKDCVKKNQDKDNPEAYCATIERKIINAKSKYYDHVRFWNVKPDSRYNKVQLRMGTEIEMEHTTQEWVAEMIAKHHLGEFPDYYTRLKKMEKQAKSDWKKKKK